MCECCDLRAPTITFVEGRLQEGVRENVVFAKGNWNYWELCGNDLCANL